MTKWCKYVFADGYTVYAGAMGADERKAIERKHGKLVTKSAHTY